ncbi:MAG: DNA endonuclease SmrA [Gammaproteobacteria bacterium]|nr:DNA endonuclease SmrA [Gammaproteobacteria bacterium]
MSKNTDETLFSAEMEGVKPIKQDKIIQSAKAEAKSTDYRQQQAESFARPDKNFLTDTEVASVEPNAVLSYKKDGVQPAVFKKLRLGKYIINDRLDLHRKTVEESRQAVFSLVELAKKRHFRCLLITHGKGFQSNPPARLKSFVDHWLKQFDDVLAFHSAQPEHGGTGSVYVLIKKQPDFKLNAAKYD